MSDSPIAPTQTASATKVAAAAPAGRAEPGWRAVLKSGWQQLIKDIKEMFERRGFATLRYLMTTEVHTYAFSVAANAILSFFPFMMLLMMLTRRVFRSPAMTNVVSELLRDFLPAGQEFIVRNLNAMVNARQSIQIAALLILLFTSSGVFLPLEVALNKVWGISKNRGYLDNQLVSLGLAFAVGVLALLSVAATAGVQIPLLAAFSGSNNMVVRTVSFVVMKIFAMVASVGIFHLVYWLLPNGKVSARAVLPAAVITGLLWELGKLLYIKTLPWLDFKEVYGPFAISVTLMFWAYVSGMLLLAGAHLSASPEKSGSTSATETQ